MKFRGIEHVLKRRVSLIGLLHHAWLKVHRYEQYVDKDGLMHTGRHLRNGDKLKLNASHMLRLNLNKDIENG